MDSADIRSKVALYLCSHDGRPDEQAIALVLALADVMEACGKSSDWNPAVSRFSERMYNALARVEALKP